MRLVVFYRAADMRPEELDAALAAGFACTDSRMTIRHDDLVVGRYSVLPFYKEIARDLEYTGARLINTRRQHAYVADLRNWVEDLGILTPKTWYRSDQFMEDPTTGWGPFVLKGQTNSRKDRWSTHMFAPTKKDVMTVYDRLLQDGFFTQAGDGHQEIYIRQYVPLVTYARGIGGLPVTKEFRIFVCRRQIVSGAYYWSSWADTCLEVNPEWKEPDVNEVPEEFLTEVIERIGHGAEFMTIDVAQDETDRWWVIDVNDGQMSGLSGNQPNVLYPSLYRVLSAAP